MIPPRQPPHLPALPPGSMSTPSPAESRYRPPFTPGKSFYARKARAIYEAQMREHILRRKQAGCSFEELALELGVSQFVVRKLYRQALERLQTMPPRTSRRLPLEQM